MLALGTLVTFSIYVSRIVSAFTHSPTLIYSIAMDPKMQLCHCFCPLSRVSSRRYCNPRDCCGPYPSYFTSCTTLITTLPLQHPVVPLQLTWGISCQGEVAISLPQPSWKAFRLESELKYKLAEAVSHRNVLDNVWDVPYIVGTCLKPDKSNLPF
jgi:hypothetical protein